MGESTGTIDEEIKQGIRLKRKEFRDYLENTGTLDALTRGLVALYENPVKPTNPVAFFMEHLSLGVSMKAEIDALKQELAATREKLSESVSENLELRSALTVRRTTTGPGGGQGYEQPDVKAYEREGSASAETEIFSNENANGRS